MIFDIIVLAVLLISSIIAFLRGFIREILTILGVGGGIVASLALGPVLSPVVRGWFGVGTEGEEPERLMGVIPYNIVADVIAYGGVFVIVVIILSIISHFLASGAKAAGLGAIDRTLGVVFGVVRGIFLLALMYLPIYMTVEADTRDNWFGDSKTRFYIEATSGWMSKVLPESLSSDIEEQMDQNGEGVIKATREKLQDIDVLRKQDKADETTVPPSTDEADPGYDKEERSKMNRLFEERYND
ncbi:MAG: CvpA family protein [Rhodospirillales bacterium]|nr:CvpA family protein [Rhodospirillales bacterium]